MNTAMLKIDKNPCHQGVYILVRKGILRQIPQRCLLSNRRQAESAKETGFAISNKAIRDGLPEKRGLCKKLKSAVIIPKIWDLF